MNYVWKITDIYAANGLITQAKYLCTAYEDDLSVETEGTWIFDEPKMNVEFDQVTEEMIAEWIDTASKGLIKENLQKQLTQSKPVTAHPPWLPKVFTPNI